MKATAPCSSFTLSTRSFSMSRKSTSISIATWTRSRRF
jgi:hypothetical protein